ncbi:CAP domain-containing protein [bacterium]|nr:CAP domain-containing protein [bacterium]
MSNNRLLFHVSLFLCFASAQINSQTYNFIQDDFNSIEGVAIAEQAIWKLVNAERQKAGLSELSYDVSLQSAARQHSQEMLKLNYFSHTSPIAELKNPSDRVYRTGLSDYVVGENIAVHSLDVAHDEIAAQLMEQWMKSPGHRANILRPEFTHIGAGVISFKDSVVKDTLIRGARGRLVIYTIRHYGTQVFAARSISFSKLTLSKSISEFLILDLRYDYDRGALASFNNYTQFFQPSEGKMSIYIEFPLQPAIQIFLAHIQNDYTKEYTSFFQDIFVYENILKTMDKLSLIPYPIRSKEIRIEKKPAYFLEGEAVVLNGNSNTQCLMHVDDERYYELEADQNKIYFKIPIVEDGKTKKILWAFGSTREKTVRNLLMIDTAELKVEGPVKKVFVKN